MRYPAQRKHELLDECPLYWLLGTSVDIIYHFLRTNVLSSQYTTRFPLSSKVSKTRLMVVDHLPRPALAVQEKGDSSICNVRLPVDLALEMEAQKSRGNIAENIHRHIAHLHRSDPFKEPGYPLVVVFYPYPASHWLGHFLSNVNDMVVVLVPDGLEPFYIHDGKPMTILLNDPRNLLSVQLTYCHSTFSLLLSQLTIAVPFYPARLPESSQRYEVRCDHVRDRSGSAHEPASPLAKRRFAQSSV